MKVAVQCESALLQRSLELFLEDDLSSIKQCDVVLRDKQILDSHHSLFISSEQEADVKKPFSRTQLYFALEQFYKKQSNIQKIQEYTQELTSSPIENGDDLSESSFCEHDFSFLEEQIDHLTQEYKAKILKTVKAFYE